MASDDPRDSEIMARAEALLATGRFSEVIQLCESVQLSQRLPRKFWFCKARAFEGIGDISRAIDAYRCEIASVSRIPPDILTQIGVLLAKLGCHENSLWCLDLACQLDPTPDRWIFLASTLFRLDRASDAQHAIEEALKIDANNDEAWHNLGTYFMHEDLEKAEKAFRHALKIDPRQSKSAGGLAMVHVMQGRPEEALTVAAQGLEIDSLDGICHEAIARAKELLGDLGGAQESYERALRCDYDRPTALLALARLFGQQHMYEQELQCYERALHAWPDQAEVRNACLSFMKGKPVNDPKISKLSELYEKVSKAINLLPRYGSQ